MGYGRFASPATPIARNVNTLDDYDPSDPENIIEGSLRWAIEEFDVPRIIVFDSELEGVIQLKTGLNITTPHVAIFGDTAGDDRITIQGEEFGIRNTNNIIIRYLRFRSGVLDPENPRYHCGRSFNIFADKTICHDIILDHCSIGPSRDDNLAISGPVCRLTIQNCLIGGGLVNQSKSTIVDGQGGDMASGSMTFCHNVFTNTGIRQPYIAYRGRFDLFNNVIGNSQKSVEIGSGSTGAVGPEINIFHNYFRTSDTLFGSSLRDPITAHQYTGTAPAPTGRLHVSSNENKIFVAENYFERWEDEGDPCAVWEDADYSVEWNLTEEITSPNTDLASSMQRGTMWAMPSDGANLNMDPRTDPEEFLEDIIWDAGCTPLDDYDLSLVTAYCTGEELFPTGSPEATDTVPGVAYGPTPENQKIVPIPIPTELCWYGSDETEHYTVQWREWVDHGQQNPWSDLITNVPYEGENEETCVSTNSVFEADTTYEWRVVPCNTCKCNDVTITTWAFRAQ